MAVSLPWVDYVQSDFDYWRESLQKVFQSSHPVALGRVHQEPRYSSVIVAFAHIKTYEIHMKTY